jgi:hypothetical protein
MRAVGEFKNSEIRLDSMHLSGTYSGIYSMDSYAEVNDNIISKMILEEIQRIYGDDRPFVIAESRTLKSPDKRLPDTMGIAWLVCAKVIKDGDANGSNLFLVWFQDAQADPYGALSGTLATIDWAKHARDYYL